MRPTMARLTLARKIASITLTIWKKGVDFDATQLHRQDLSVSDEEAFPSPAILSSGGRSGSRDARFEVSISQ
jgi:hypothetical protein